MRDIPYSFNEKLHQRIQTKATQADPRPSLWISRKTTQLTDSVFLESAVVAEGNITDCSIAVRHKRFGFESDCVFIAYVKNGVARMTCSPTFTEMSRHKWVDCGFQQPAEAVSIAFDGTMPKDTRNKYEFITDTEPWVFWISSGALYCKAPGGTILTLATVNVTDISAVRAMWSDVPGFNFGLIVFFIINGAVHYRQYIDGVWNDAETMPEAVLPTGKVWKQINAQRTWDYRVALQLVATDGTIYECFSQYEGIGGKNADHIGVKRITAQGIITAIKYSSYKSDFYLAVSDFTGPLYGGLYSLAPPSIIDAYNVNDGNGNYGKQVIAVFNVHMKASEVLAHYLSFTLVDSSNVVFIASSAVMQSDGKTVLLTFTDFNNAYGSCVLKYTPGTATSMADISAPESQTAFTPGNLVPIDIPFPEVESIWNE